MLKFWDAEGPTAWTIEFTGLPKGVARYVYGTYPTKEKADIALARLTKDLKSESVAPRWKHQKPRVVPVTKDQYERDSAIGLLETGYDIPSRLAGKYNLPSSPRRFSARTLRRRIQRSSRAGTKPRLTR